MSHFLFFVFTFIFSILINRLFLKFSGTLGAKNNQDNSNVIRWASTSKPAFGGISFFIVFLVSFVLYATFFNEEKILNSFFGVFVASSLGFVIGLADDAYNTKPWLKFLGQIACGIILVLTGNCIDVFDNQIFNYALTIFWVIGMMNSINMLDNMDAITTLVSASVIASALIVLIVLGEFTHLYFWIMLGVLSSLLGFLYYNWNPSKMYMGDTGSQFLGVFLAAIGIYFFWNGHGLVDQNRIGKFITAILIFLPAICDTATVVINRLAKKTSPFVGGKDHTTHHLSYLGLNDRQVALVFLGISLLSGSIAIYINYYLKFWSKASIIAVLLYCLTVFITLFTITKVKKGN
jgi:UDP-GlcNAc:undecaprenyl-phosphate GlcNAc-1-phosphate transferase